MGGSLDPRAAPQPGPAARRHPRGDAALREPQIVAQRDSPLPAAAQPLRPPHPATGQGSVKALLSDDHFSVDGTLIEAWASLKSFRRQDGSGEPPAPGRNGERDFHGEKRRNQTHASTTDPDARLFKKSKGSEAKLGYLGHVLMENRNGLLVQTFVTEANGGAERDAAMLMAETIPGGKRVTLAGDKNYDTQELVRELRGMNITPHVAQNDTNRRSAVDQRTTRHAGYEVSQRKRKRVEQSFGWMKMVGMLL